MNCHPNRDGAANDLRLKEWRSDQVAGKYPPAEPRALRIGPLEAATLNPKICPFGRHTNTPSRPSTPFQFFLRHFGGRTDAS
jgi:hypothetical protein